MLDLTDIVQRSDDYSPSHTPAWKAERDRLSASMVPPDSARPYTAMPPDPPAWTDAVSYTHLDVYKRQGITKQYIFISSASAYQKTLSCYEITESTPLYNPDWDYAQKKISCENELMYLYLRTGFPITIIRPSHTYDEYNVPLCITGWNCLLYTSIGPVATMVSAILVDSMGMELTDMVDWLAISLSEMCIRDSR